MILNRRTLLTGAAALGTLPLARAATAQDFPARPIQGTIQWGAGGSTDAVTRAVAPIVEEKLGQKLVLTNRPGGTGVIGMQYVHSQRPDGYNILFGAENPQLYGVLGLSELSYKDFYPLVLLARGTPVLVARKDAPWPDTKALIEHVKVDVDPATNVPQLVVSLRYDTAPAAAPAAPPESIRVAFAADALPPEQHTTVAGHVRRCRACSADVGDLRSLHASARGRGCLPGFRGR